MRTIATVWGKLWRARIAFYLITGTAICVMMVPYLRNLYLDQLALCSINQGVCQVL